MADQDLYGETTTLDAKLITIKKQIAAKLDVQSAFADREVQSRNLRAKFKYCDASGTGTLSYDEFSAAMVRLNFVGVPKEMYALFCSFDKDDSGEIDYKEFADAVLGVDPADSFT